MYAYAKYFLWLLMLFRSTSFLFYFICNVYCLLISLCRKIPVAKVHVANLSDLPFIPLILTAFCANYSSTKYIRLRALMFIKCSCIVDDANYQWAIWSEAWTFRCVYKVLWNGFERENYAWSCVKVKAFMIIEEFEEKRCFI